MKNKFLSDKDYNFIYSRVPRLCVDLIVKTSQGVLLSKRLIAPYKNTWHTPGGRVYFRETLVQAINRIALKEIGSRVKIIKLAGYMEFVREIQNNQPRHSISTVWLVEPLKVKLRGSWQVEELVFFKKLPKNTHPIHKKFLKENNFLK